MPCDIPKHPQWCEQDYNASGGIKGRWFNHHATILTQDAIVEPRRTCTSQETETNPPAVVVAVQDDGNVAMASIRDEGGALLENNR